MHRSQQHSKNNISKALISSHRTHPDLFAQRQINMPMRLGGDLLAWRIHLRSQPLSSIVSFY